MVFSCFLGGTAWTFRFSVHTITEKALVLESRKGLCSQPVELIMLGSWYGGLNKAESRSSVGWGVQMGRLSFIAGTLALLVAVTTHAALKHQALNQPVGGGDAAKPAPHL